jgi:cytochrome c553
MLLALTSLSQPAIAAFDGDAGNGRKLFLAKGKNDKACMTCHPLGLTTGEVFRGKDIPDLVEAVKKLSEKKIRNRTNKHVFNVVDLEMTDSDLEDLCTFVAELPENGFGAVPVEWQAHVRKYVTGYKP